MPRSPRGQVALEACERYPDIPTITLARYLIHQYGDLFEYDEEKARGFIRQYRGETGKRNRELTKHIVPKCLPRSMALKHSVHTLAPGLYLVMGDIHVPYHEPGAVEAAVGFAREQKVSGIVLNGDVQDCGAVSPWTSTRKRDFCREVELTRDFIDWLNEALPDVEHRVWKPGNHEDRLPNYYARNAPELLGSPTTTLEVTLALDVRGWEFLSMKQAVRAGKLTILHGHELRGGTTAVNPARWLFLKAKGLALCSHWHRSSDHSETNIKGELIKTWSIGCLCDLHPDYNPMCNSWDWGFALVNVERGGMFEVEKRSIIKDGIKYKVV